MKIPVRTLFLIAWLSAAAGGLTPWGAGSAAFAQTDAKPKTRLAVTDLLAGEGLPKDAGMTLSGFICDEFSKSGKFQLLDRQKVRERMMEIDFSASNTCDQKCRLTKCGQSLDAAKIVGGHVSSFGKAWTLTLYLIDVNTGVTDDTFVRDYQGAMEDMLNLAREGARHLLGLAPDKNAPASPAEKSLILDLGGGVTMELVLIPAGSFMMGSPESEEEQDGDEGPQHRVTIARPSYVGKTEVTVGQFRRFVEATGYRTDAEKGGQAWEEGKKGGYLWAGSSVKWDESASWRNPGFAQTPSDPVVLVSWNDAKAFCAWAARETGRPVRLPSEAEWEYACRAGTSTPFHFGATISTDQANYDGNYTYGQGKKGVYRQKTTPVGSFAPNAWGLYDMHGNTWEWCEDVWHDDYNGAPTDGRAWLEGESSDTVRVLRGGSWVSYPGSCRSAVRDWLRPGGRVSSLGFRVLSGT